MDQLHVRHTVIFDGNDQDPKAVLGYKILLDGLPEIACLRGFRERYSRYGPMAEKNLAELSFDSQKSWERWLKSNHATSPGVWLRIGKKETAEASVTYDEAVEAALCYGWIDGQKKAKDEAAWLQRFTPRGPRSVWSRNNKEKAEKLIAAGRMAAYGLAAVEKARGDGRWDAAYQSQSAATVPEDLEAALDADPEARAFFSTLSSVNRYAILFRLQTAKRPETRARRLNAFLVMLRRHLTIH